MHTLALQLFGMSRPNKCCLTACCAITKAGSRQKHCMCAPACLQGPWATPMIITCCCPFALNSWHECMLSVICHYSPLEGTAYV